MTDANQNQKSTCDNGKTKAGKKRPPVLPIADQNAQQPPIVEAVKGEFPKRGAPVGNQNATKHGLRSDGLALGKMPAKAEAAEKRRRYFERWLIEALAAAGITDAPRHRVQACVIKEGQRLLIERWLRLDNEASPIETRLRLLDAAASALDARNAIIEELGLKPATGRPSDLAAFYGNGGAK